MISLSLEEIMKGGLFLMDAGNMLIFFIAQDHDP